MELKHVIDGQAIQGIFCSNCTFMELKLQEKQNHQAYRRF